MADSTRNESHSRNGTTISESIQPAELLSTKRDDTGTSQEATSSPQTPSHTATNAASPPGQHTAATMSISSSSIDTTGVLPQQFRLDVSFTTGVVPSSVMNVALTLDSSPHEIKVRCPIPSGVDHFDLGLTLPIVTPVLSTQPTQTAAAPVAKFNAVRGSDAVQIPTKPPLTFNSLPAEIRLMIYDYCVEPRMIQIGITEQICRANYEPYDFDEESTTWTEEKVSPTKDQFTYTPPVMVPLWMELRNPVMREDFAVFQLNKESRDGLKQRCYLPINDSTMSNSRTTYIDPNKDYLYFKLGKRPRHGAETQYPAPFHLLCGQVLSHDV
ncbi:hypothetical protein GLAREA_02729 [Glarea lozoyensis ATCC 20868]|uniref:2EXR domain-containing protein n=1 Tax=Glarea lozoyensis (strain ATCC 20868 / MF5171) TaxID=1116229 RepID=S3CMA2_GLAL2|nr:uncharacterized protein GLAREA_02729 [Glarea lozoyensis ATCC 20868]EPE26815.1 hypothetical protein GLAREA_02729 [Glarea lozoyensis ATCC 20868]